MLFFENLKEHGKTLLNLINQTVKEDQVFNSLNFFFRYTLDSISVIAYGENLNSLQETSPLSVAFDVAQESTSERVL